MVSSMTISGNYLFAAAGDTIYKINIENMAIMGQAKLPQPRPQQFGQGGQGQGQGQNPPRGGQARGNGNGNGNGNIPPNNK